MPGEIGGDFIFIHNPKARNPVSHGFIKVGTEYIPFEEKDVYRLEEKHW
jgi:hypothetical protein